MVLIFSLWSVGRKRASISINKALNRWAASKEKAKYLRTARGFAAVYY